MTDIVLPPDLIALQRAVYTAEAAVEAHRRRVDARRRAEAVVVKDGPRPTLPPWSPAEDAEHERLMAELRVAAEARRAGLLASGLGGAYDVVQALHREARQA